MALKQSTHGFDSLAYIGSPFTPAAVYIQERNPTPKDNQGIPLGTIWINLITRGVFILVEKLYDPGVKKTQATWIDMVGINSVVTDAGSAVPVAGVINILGGLNIHTTGAGNTVTIHLDDTVHISGEMIADAGLVTTAGNINLPNTVTDGSAGIIQFGVDRWISNFGSQNTFVGESSGNTTTTGAGANVGIGFASLNLISTGNSNSFLGFSSGLHIDVGNANSVFGFAALGSATSSSLNVALGYRSLPLLLTGSYNIALGRNSGTNYTGAESSNILISNSGVLGESHIIRLGTDGTGNGEQDACYIAGTTHITRNLNLKFTNGAGTQGAIYTGDGVSLARFITNPGTFNVFVGEASGPTYPFAGAASDNTGIGANVLTAIAGALGCTAAGFGAGNAVTNAVDSTMLGHNAGNVLLDGGLNTLIGAYSGVRLTTGGGNSALGNNALDHIVTGGANLGLGGGAGQALTGADSSNVVIQNNGVSGISNTIWIGTEGAGNGQQNRCFIAGIRGHTTGVADAIPVLIDSAGQLGTISSSERYKDDIEDMGPESDMIMALRPVTFTYKSDSTKRMQYGLIAEEVADLFPNLVVYDKDELPDTIRYHELPVLLLNELQKYAMVIENLKERIEVLERSIH